MPQRRRTALVLLPALLAAAAAGCARTGGGRRRASATVPAVLRFAEALEEADETVDGVIARMDGFERMAAREDAAIAYAAGGPRDRTAPRFTPPPAGAAEAAGRVLNPAFTALGDYGHVLAQVAEGDPIVPRATPSGAQLAAAVQAGLRAVQATSGTPVPEPVRGAGLRGVATLADLPDELPRRGRAPALDALVAEAQPHLAAVAAMLRAVVGAEPGQGTRGAIRARREALDASQSRFLEALRSDRRIGPGERYSIFRSVSELRDNDPVLGNFAAIIALLAAMEEAHAALGGAGGEAESKVALFEAQVARLGALGEGSSRG